MFGQIVQRFCCPFQILNSCPPLVSGALLSLDIVLNVNEQADPPATQLWLPEVAESSGDPKGNGFFRVIGTQVFELDEPLRFKTLADIYFPRLISYPSRCNWISKSSMMEYVGINRSTATFNLAL